jgi:hypothetical protein
MRLAAVQRAYEQQLTILWPNLYLFAERGKLCRNSLGRGVGRIASPADRIDHSRGAVHLLSSEKKGDLKMVRSVAWVTRQSWFLPAVLVVISAVSSWKFACITPFVAFAVAAGYALSPRMALFTVMAIWIANQAIGFAVLGYPWTVDTILWGFAIGAAALLAAVLACVTLRLRLRNNVTATGTAFVLAFGAYEGVLFLVTFGLGGEDAFTSAIVGHVALLNLGWTVGLVGTYEILRYSGAITAQRRGGSAAPSPV